MTEGPRHPPSAPSRRAPGPAGAGGPPGQVPACRRRVPSPPLAEFSDKFVQKWHRQNNPWLRDGMGGLFPSPPTHTPPALPVVSRSAKRATKKQHLATRFVTGKAPVNHWKEKNERILFYLKKKIAPSTDYCCRNVVGPSLPGATFIPQPA